MGFIGIEGFYRSYVKHTGVSYVYRGGLYKGYREKCVGISIQDPSSFRCKCECLHLALLAGLAWKHGQEKQGSQHYSGFRLLKAQWRKDFLVFFIFVFISFLP